MDEASSFQMVSLLKLAQVTEEGVKFLSPHDRTPMYGRPQPLSRPLSCANGRLFAGS